MSDQRYRYFDITVDPSRLCNIRYQFFRGMEGIVDCEDWCWLLKNFSLAYVSILGVST